MHDGLFERVAETLQEVQASFSWCDGDSLPCKDLCILLWGDRAGALKHNSDHVMPSGEMVQNDAASSKLFPGTVSPRDLVTPKHAVSCEPWRALCPGSPATSRPSFCPGTWGSFLSLVDGPFSPHPHPFPGLSLQSSFPTCLSIPHRRSPRAAFPKPLLGYVCYFPLRQMLLYCFLVLFFPQNVRFTSSLLSLIHCTSSELGIVPGAQLGLGKPWWVEDWVDE